MDEIVSPNSSYNPTPRQPVQQYRPKKACALRLEAGQSLWLSMTRQPENLLLTLGEHFTWNPPHRGRVARCDEFHGDPSSAVEFTAKVPLLVSLHEPWPNQRGGVTIGHFRLARETRAEFDLVMNLPPENFMEDPGRLKVTLKENHRPQHMSAGGPRYAVAYKDERVVPAFWYKEGSEHIPRTFILHEDELPALMLAWRQQARIVRETVEDPQGTAGRQVFLPKGNISSREVNGVVVWDRTTRQAVESTVKFSYDENGVVSSIQVNGNLRGSVQLFPGVMLTMSSMIQDRKIRAFCGLPSLETGAVESTNDRRLTLGINTVVSAFTEAEKIAAVTPRHQTVDVQAVVVAPVAEENEELPPPKEIPRAERRTVPPKLNSLLGSGIRPQGPEPVVAEAAEPIAEVEAEEDNGNMFEWKEDGLYYEGEPVIVEMEKVTDVDPAALTELEIHLLEQLPSMMGMDFGYPVSTGDGRLIVDAGVPVTPQDLVNLVAYREGMTGNEDEMELILAALKHGEDTFVPAPPPPEYTKADRIAFNYK